MRVKLTLVVAFFIFQFSFAHTKTFTVPILPNIQPLTYCDSNNDGFGVFDLTAVTPIILAAQSGASSDYTISYHETMADAASVSNPITALYNNINPFTQTIYYLIVQIGNGDAAIGSFQLVVNTTPIAGSVSSIAVCDADANPLNGSTSIDLTQQTAAILALQPLPASNYVVSYYTTIVSAENGTSPIFSDTNYIGSNGDTIWYRVENNVSSCFNVGSFQLVVNSAPFATGPQFFADCDNYSNPDDGVGIIDLTQFAASILNGQNPVTHQIKYFATQADAISGTNQILLSSAQSYQTPSTTIWVKVINNSGCYSLTTISINITASPNPIINTIDNRSAICVDFITHNVIDPLILNSGIVNPSAYTFIWVENGTITVGTDPTYTVNTALANGATRVYSVTVTSNNALGCRMTSSSYSVIQSGPAVIPPGTNGYTITNLSGVQSITVNIIGYSYGEYEYSLDSGPRQTSNVFENVSLGSHTINVWDTEGGLFYSCDPLVISGVEIATSEIPAPTGLISQTFPAGSTLANIVVNGTDIQWYASANNKNQLSTFSMPLPLNTLLVDGTTYYATQTVGGIESTAYLPVMVHLTLGVGDNEVLPVQYAPNPVKNSLTLQSTVVLKTVSIYTMLGQKVFEQNYNNTNISIDLSRLTTGNYIFKAQGETGQKTIRIIKE